MQKNAFHSRIKWFGHVTGNKDDNYVIKSYKEEFPGRSKRERTHQKWSDQIRNDFNLSSQLKETL